MENTASSPQQKWQIVRETAGSTCLALTLGFVVAVVSFFLRQALHLPTRMIGITYPTLAQAQWDIIFGATIMAFGWSAYWREHWRRDDTHKLTVYLLPVVGFLLGFPDVPSLIWFITWIGCIILGVMTLIHDRPALGRVYRAAILIPLATCPVMMLGHGLHGGYLWGCAYCVLTLIVINWAFIPIWLAYWLGKSRPKTSEE